MSSPDRYETEWRSLSVLFVCVLLLALPAMAATSYSCKDGKSGQGCQYEASCTGDDYSWTSECSVQCYEHTGNPGEITSAGSASCGGSTGGGDECDTPHCGPFDETPD